VRVKFLPNLNPYLNESGIFNVEHLFYEIWAFIASRHADQGARRLHQYMDELLIYPMEYFRLRNMEWFERKDEKTIHLVFKPFITLGIDYDKAEILLIDDDVNEHYALNKILDGLPIEINYADFNQKEDIKKYASSSAVILLDLLKDGKQIGMDVLEEINNDISSPVLIYSKMSEGSELDLLKAELWKYNIYGYVNKKCGKNPNGTEETEEVKNQRIKDKIFIAIQAFYTNKRLEEGKKITTAKLIPPDIGKHDKEAIFSMGYKIDGKYVW
jgi:hypothetical protein